MIKRVAVRKLNRTLLKKEGTKEFYITSKSFLDLFGKDIALLPTRRNDPDAKLLFKVENSGSHELIELALTKENNEVRLTGFDSFFLDNDVKETDELVFNVNVFDGGTEYILEVIKKENVRVMQKYSINDNANNYSIVGNQATPKEQLEDYPNTYWFWDDSFDSKNLNKFQGMKVAAYFSFNEGKKRCCMEKTIRIHETDQLFPKLLKAQLSSNSSNYIQNKKLYVIQELVNGDWVDLCLEKPSLLEVYVDNDRLVFTDRSENSMCLFMGETIV